MIFYNGLILQWLWNIYDSTNFVFVGSYWRLYIEGPIHAITYFRTYTLGNATKETMQQFYSNVMIEMANHGEAGYMLELVLRDMNSDSSYPTSIIPNSFYLYCFSLGKI